MILRTKLNVFIVIFILSKLVLTFLLLILIFLFLIF
jgi:hypothetical protein